MSQQNVDRSSNSTKDTLQSVNDIKRRHFSVFNVNFKHHEIQFLVNFIINMPQKLQ